MPQTRISTASERRTIGRIRRLCCRRCGRSGLPSGVTASARRCFRFGRIRFHQAGRTARASARERPHRLQKRRVGRFPSPHSPQTRSPSSSRRLGADFGTARRAGGRSCGATTPGSAWAAATPARAGCVPARGGGAVVGVVSGAARAATSLPGTPFGAAPALPPGGGGGGTAGLVALPPGGGGGGTAGLVALPPGGGGGGTAGLVALPPGGGGGGTAGLPPGGFAPLPNPLPNPPPPEP